MAESFFHMLKGGIRFSKQPSTNRHVNQLGPVQITEEEQNVETKDDDVKLDSTEKINIFRKNHRIKVYGTDPPVPLASMSELKALCKGECNVLIDNAMCDFGYKHLTSVQAQAIPVLLNERDVVAIAPTGSGKTFAFLFPLLYHISSILPGKKKLKKAVNDTICPMGLVLSPTRELAEQIYREATRLLRQTTMTVQLLKGDVDDSDIAPCSHLLITTPLRLVYELRKKPKFLCNVRMLVFDEGDKLLDMGFLEQVDDIVSACTHQPLIRAFFSATIPPLVEQLSDSFMHDPLRVVVGTRNTATDTIKQKLVYVGKEQGKLLALRQAISSGQLQFPLLIFVQSVDRAQQLYRELMYDPIHCDIIHAQRSNEEREEVVRAFRSGRVWTLICTEVLSRGLDFQHVRCVINFDMPQSVTSYIHRIGRTGRAGRRGEAITFFTDEDRPFLRAIAQVAHQSGEIVPSWMLQLQKLKKRDRRQHEKFPPKRESIDSSKGAMLLAPQGEQKKLQQQRVRKEKERKRGRLAVEAERKQKNSQKRKKSKMADFAPGENHAEDDFDSA